MFDVFLLRGKEEEDGGLTFDPDTGLLQFSAFFLFSNFRKGRLLYIRPVGRSVGWSVGWPVG